MFKRAAMEKHVFGSTIEIEDKNWWYRSRRNLLGMLIKKHAPENIEKSLDIGCGVGSNFSLLRGEAYGLDIDQEALAFCKTKGYDYLVYGDIAHNNFQDNFFDLILCSEVLEHIFDDRSAVKEVKRILKPGGVAILTVPAFSILWHDNDIIGNHHRRYRKKQFAGLIEKEGLKIERISYWNFFFFLPALLVVLFSRLADKKDKKDLKLNMGPRFMDYFTELSFWENKLFLRVNWPFGTSIVAVVRK
ncbi:MAG: hypothetical protein QG620_423 [Patescibacteria group bacterium]|nr:hypothetical protein [Patescibacteria group bacterium]